MPRFHRSMLALAVGLLLAVAVQAQAKSSTVYVSPSGSDTSGTGTAASPFATAAKGISSAPAGAAVVLEPGVYKTTLAVTKQIKLESDSSKPDAVSKTVIDASGQINGIVVQGERSAGAVIEGLTVKNAQKAGILVMNTYRITVAHNVVTANDQSCAGYQDCVNPNSSPEAPQGKFTFTNGIPCGNADSKKHPGMDCEALHLIGVNFSKVIANTVEGNLDGGIYLTDETGPTHANWVEGNLVTRNLTDCGITLASHNPNAAGHPRKAGIYDNIVSLNAVIDNGAAGVIMAGPVPGAASYNNTVTANIAVGNGMPGIAVHSHASGQNMSHNVISNNFVSGNGTTIGDPFAGLTPKQTAGIVVFSAKAPITDTKVQNNRIANEHFGVWFSSTVRNPVDDGNRLVGLNAYGTRMKVLLKMANAAK